MKTLVKILFVTANRVGDAVLSTGLLGHLAERHPLARVTIACGPVAAPLFEDFPALDRLLPIAKRKRAGHWLDLWRECAGTHWDLVVDLRASALAWTLRARRRMVLRKTRQRLHRVALFGRLAGIEPPPAPRLWLSADRRARAERLVPPGAPVLAVGPTANWGGKQWPAERFAEAVARLTAADGILPGARVAVFGGPGEREAAAPLLDSIPAARRLDLVGGPGLAEVAACLERAALYLGNDSGLMHLAAATGIPTLGLFGPSPEALYAPWGPRAAVLRTPQSYAALVGDPGFDHRSQQSLMTGLEVEAVVEAAAALWRGGEKMS